MRFQRRGFVVRWDSVLEPFCAFLWFSLGCLARSSSILNLIIATIWKHVWCQQRGLLSEMVSVDRWVEPVYVPYGSPAHHADSPKQPWYPSASKKEKKPNSISLFFNYKILTSKQTAFWKTLHKPFKNSSRFTGICPLQSQTEKSRDTTQQEGQQEDDHAVFGVLKESRVFLLSFHSLSPRQLHPLRGKTTKTNEFGLLKRSVKHLPPVSRGSTEVSVFPVYPLQRL